jgi:hypothetical protein
MRDAAVQSPFWLGRTPEELRNPNPLRINCSVVPNSRRPVQSMPRGSQLRHCLALGLAFSCGCIAVASAGCGGDELRLEEQSACEADLAKTNSVLACTVDATCPPGTLCAVAGTRKPCTSKSSCQCEAVYFPATSADVLTTRFQSAEFDLVEEPDGSYSFEAPTGANIAVCGSFISDPEIFGQRIANAEKSLYRTHTFAIPRASSPVPRVFHFDLSDLNSEGNRWVCDGVFSPAPVGAKTYPIVTSLRVGCWAYDRVRLVAATRLHSVDVNTLPEVKPLVRDCASKTGGDLDERLCLPSPRPGLCRDGTCIDLRAPADAGDSTAQSSTSDADGGDDNTPLLVCEGSTNGEACQAGLNFAVGRCVGSRCADQSVTNVEMPLVVRDCAVSDSTDWLNCFSSTVQGYGSCLGSRCRLRCTTNDDCREAATFLGDNVERTYVCTKSSAKGAALCQNATGGSYIGVCQERDAPECQ